VVLAIDSFEETFRSKLQSYLYFPQYAGPSGFLHGQSECPPALASFLADGAGYEAGDALHLLIRETSRNAHADQGRRERRSHDYWQLKGLQGLLRAHGVKLSVGGCSWKAKPAYVNKFVLSADGRHMQKIQIPTGYSGKIEVHKTDGKAHYHGLHRCGNVNICPVCNRRISAKRGDECRKIARYMLEHEFKFLFVTFTASHNERMGFKEIREKFTAAFTDFCKHNLYKKFRNDIGLEYHILSNEVTDDNPYTRYKTGWHFHKHLVMFFKRDESFTQNELDSIYEKLLKIWKQCLNRYNLTCNEHGIYIPGIEDRAKFFSKDDNDIDKIVNYISKGISYELTGARNKNHNAARRRISVWELQDLAIKSKNKSIEERYLDYVVHVKGLPSVHFSRGLRDLCGIAVKNNHELVQDAEGQEVIYSFEDPKEWRAVVRQAGQGKLLSYVEDGGRIEAAIDAALAGYDIETGEWLGVAGAVPSPERRRRRREEEAAVC